jgi:hypothetical protein
MNKKASDLLTLWMAPPRVEVPAVPPTVGVGALAGSGDPQTGPA